MTVKPRFTLLNTRPVHQAKALSKGVLEIGGKVLNCPTLQIQWRSQAELLLRLPQDFELYDKVILTSANSVQGLLNSHLKPSVDPLACKTRYFAIGKATRQAGLDNHLPIERLTADRFDSEALLQDPLMQSVKGESILIVKGQAGRSLLGEQLTEQGAQVDTWDVYQRIPADFCKQHWQEFIKSTYPILLITSVESFESLMAGLLKLDKDYGFTPVAPHSINQINQAWSFLKDTIVFSERIKQAMRQQGWQSSVCVVEQQSDLGIIQAIERFLPAER
jgi:uroporphyrinogen-III synthase